MIDEWMAIISSRQDRLKIKPHVSVEELNEVWFQIVIIELNFPYWQYYQAFQLVTDLSSCFQG